MKSASSSGRSKSSGRSSSSSYRKGSNSSSSGSQSSSSRRPQQQSRFKPAQKQAPVELVASSLPDGDGGEWLAKALASSGVASRRACIDLVKAGKVKVNGVVVTDPATKVDASADRLFVDGKHVSAAAAAATSCYFAVHKPAGYICSNVSKEPGTRAVDLLQPWLDKWQDKHRGQLPPRLFTVGRLDVATSGLLFITNDGDWANQVIHPSADITKEYWVTLPQDPSQKELQQLRAGTTIDGVRVVPKVVQILRRAISTSDDDDAAADAAAGPAGQRSSRRGSSSSSNSSKGGKRESSSDEELGVVKGVGGSREKLSIGGKGCVLRLDVSEGKKHEVRLLVAAAGLRLLRLKRVRVGGFVMPDKLRAGQYMELTESMRAKILQQPR